VGQQAATANINTIQHIVFIIKENRAYDSLFGTYPGADGATTATISTGQVIPLDRLPILSATLTTAQARPSMRSTAARWIFST
jgi:phospholipase C